MNLEFFVSDRKLTRKGAATPVADTAAADTFTVTFDREWDGLVKEVELKNGDACERVLYTGKTGIPRQVCRRGDLYLTCHGYRKYGEATSVIHTAPMLHPVRMVGSSSASGITTQPYTPSAYEQMVAEVAKAQAAAQDARQAARELEQLRESGAFVGEKGDAATVEVVGVRYGTPATVENLGTRNRARLRFTLPYGMTEAEKQAMAEQIKRTLVGDLEQAVDEILQIQQTYIDRAEEGE